MPEELTVPPPPDTEAKLEEQNQELRFPKLDKGHATFYDKVNQVTWVGFDLKLMQDKADVDSAIGWARFFINENWKNFFFELMKRKQFENSPEGGRIANMLKKAFVH